MNGTNPGDRDKIPPILELSNMHARKLSWSLYIVLCVGPLSAQVNSSMQSDFQTVVEGDGKESASKRSEAELGFSYERLTKDFSDWLSLHVEASKAFDARTSLHASFRETERFSLKDQELTAGLRFPFGRTWAGFVEGGVSPSHQVLPKWSVVGQVERLFEIGWVVYAGLRHTEFPAAATSSAIATIETYWGSNRASYSFYLNRVEGGGSSASHVLQSSYYYDYFSSLNLTFSIGRELENIPPSGGVLSTHVRSLAFFGRHWFANRWAISYEIRVHEQGDIYTRKGARIGLRYLL